MKNYLPGLAATPHPLLSVPCAGCGASLPFVPEEERVTCEFCGATSPIPEGTRERARRHLKAISAAWSREIFDRYMGLLHDHAARTNPRTMRSMVVVMVATPLWIIVLGSEFAARFHPLLTLALVAVTIRAIGHLLDGMSGPPRPFSIPLIVASGLGSCPRCGGPLPVWEGITTARCGYCSAALLLDDARRRTFLGAAMERVAQAGTASADAVDRNMRSLEGASTVFGLFGRADLANVALAVTIAAIVGLAGLGAVLFWDAPPIYDIAWVGPALGLGLAWAVARFAFKVRRLMRAKEGLDEILRNPVRRVSPSR